MTIRTAIFILSLFFAVIPPSVSAEMYKWTNADGSLGFTDDVAKIPPQYRDEALRRAAEGNGTEGNINYSKPIDRSSAVSNSEVREERNRSPKREMTDEEKKKEEAKIRETWEGMKKALRGY
jgi:hypothetical protein